MNSKEIIQTVSKKLDIPYEVVNKAYSSYWEFVKETIKKLPLKEELTEEQFSQLSHCFANHFHLDDYLSHKSTSHLLVSCEFITKQHLFNQC